MVEYELREGEDLDAALKRFRRKCQRAGIFRDIRRNQYYTKPSVKKREKRKRAQRRRHRMRKRARKRRREEW